MSVDKVMEKWQRVDERVKAMSEKWKDQERVKKNQSGKRKVY